MLRNDFPEIRAIRYIKQNDVNKQFDNILKKKNGIGLPELLGFNTKQKHSLVYDYKDTILSFLIVDEYADYFYLNLVENNQLFKDQCRLVNPAQKLIFFVERVAISRNHSEIFLDSLNIPKLIDHYKTLGYSKVGEKLDVNYGRLVNMKKSFS